MELRVIARLASDEEVKEWQRDGWVLIEGLVDPDVIDEAVGELSSVFPTAAEYHSDPAGTSERWLGRPPAPRDSFTWPAEGPGFRPEQHRWRADFPFPGHALNRLCVHEAIVDFAERALKSTDLRIYQAGLGAKYTGETNYEQPMHTDRNHSWLPSRPERPWWHSEGFLYLSDVEAETAPTHLVKVSDAAGRPTTVPLVMPSGDPELYALERPATGPRGSFLAYRTDVFHRAVDLVEPGGARFLLNVGFKIAGHDWIGYDSMQSRNTAPEWTAFAESCSPRELSLFGFPAPGHPIWDEATLDRIADWYPKLDVSPWRSALDG